jgi:hypothetical protein
MVNVRIGKIYELHFGKDIFVKYKIILLDFENGIAVLERIDNFYSGSEMIEYCKIDNLQHKRKIYEW